MRTTARNAKLGVSVSSPLGLKASYLYRATNNNWRRPDRFRVDTPGGMYRDGRARAMLYRGDTFNSFSGEASDDFTVYFTDTMRIDAETTALLPEGDEIDGIVEVGANFSDTPFTSMSPRAFREAALARGFTIQTSDDETTTVTRNILQDDADWQQTLIYDADVGAVTQVEETVEGQAVRHRTSTSVRYVRVTQIPNMIVPYEISSSTVTTPKSGSGLRIAGGSMTATQTIRYTDIKVNSLSEAYFEGGDE